MADAAITCPFCNIRLPGAPPGKQVNCPDCGYMPSTAPSDAARRICPALLRQRSENCPGDNPLARNASAMCLTEAPIATARGASPDAARHLPSPSSGLSREMPTRSSLGALRVEVLIRLSTPLDSMMPVSKC